MTNHTPSPVEALRTIYDGAQNQDVNHKDFRIKAGEIARDALFALEQGEGEPRYSTPQCLDGCHGHTLAELIGNGSCPASALNATPGAGDRCEARQRLEAVSLGADVSDVYGSEWSAHGAAVDMRRDLRSLLGIPPLSTPPAGHVEPSREEIARVPLGLSEQQINDLSEHLCRSKNEEPLGTRVWFSDDVMHSITFFELSKRDVRTVINWIEAQPRALYKPHVGAVGAGWKPTDRELNDAWHHALNLWKAQQLPEWEKDAVSAARAFLSAITHPDAAEIPGRVTVDASDLADLLVYVDVRGEHPDNEGRRAYEAAHAKLLALLSLQVKERGND